MAESAADNPFQFGGPTPDRNDPVVSEPGSDPLRLQPPAPEPAPSLPGSAFPPQEAAPSAVNYGRGATPAAGGRSNLVLAILVPYAVCMTVLAIVYYFKYSNAASETPLDTIPDLLGHFQQKQTKGGPQTRSLRLPPPDQQLPGKLMTSLGKPLQIGEIEVTPVSVEYRSWMAFTKMKNRAEPRRVPIKPTLVLHIRLKNISPDLWFYPTDPYFDRNPKQAGDKPYTLVDVGGRKYFGGLIEYVTEPGNTERTWLQGQENDDKPLGPGESRETVLVARPGDGLFDAVRKATEPAVWRMQVRRGLVPYRGTEVPVSAVIGVSFSAADVQKIG